MLAGCEGLMAGSTSISLATMSNEKGSQTSGCFPLKPSSVKVGALLQLIAVVLMCMVSGCGSKAKAADGAVIGATVQRVERPMGARATVDGRSYEIGVYGGAPRAIPLPNLYDEQDGPIVSAAKEAESTGRLVWAWCHRHYIFCLLMLGLSWRQYELGKLGKAGQWRASIAALIAPKQSLPEAPLQAADTSNRQPASGAPVVPNPIKHGA